MCIYFSQNFYLAIDRTTQQQKKRNLTTKNYYYLFCCQTKCCLWAEAAKKKKYCYKARNVLDLYWVRLWCSVVLLIVAKHQKTHIHTQNVIWISSALFLCLIIDSFFLLIHLYKKYKINIFMSCPDIGDSLLNSCPSSDNPHEFFFIMFFFGILKTKIKQKNDGWWFTVTLPSPLLSQAGET